jgi:peptidoglycan/LPS O-acetylase OafA/YrhL
MTTQQFNIPDKKHYAELDGVRGVAVLLVMMTHYVTFEAWSMVDRVAVKVAALGWVGVGLFFVLSGFLITGILLDTRERKGYFSTFYIRRSLRIFPLYFTFIFALVAISYVLAPESPAAVQFREVQAWYWLYAVNWLIAAEGVWTATPLQTAHLWTLAIEEQFYLAWPLVVWGATRGRLMKLCFAVVVGVLALRFVLRLAGVDPISIFVATPTRIDALLMGACGALLVRGSIERPRLLWLASRAVFIGGALAIASIIVQRDTEPYGLVMETLGLSGIAAACTGLVLIVRVADPESLPRRIFRHRLLVFFGVYSYALYMLHQFSEGVVLQFFPPLAQLPPFYGVMLHWVLLRSGLATLLAVALALVSWHILEKRFLALKPEYDKGTDRTVNGSDHIEPSSRDTAARNADRRIQKGA